MFIFTIGNLALRASTSVDTIRFYERMGLMKCAERTEAGYRLYATNALHRLAFIKDAQRCGLSLAEVKVLLDAAEPEDDGRRLDAACGLARAQLDSIAETIRALRAMSDVLSTLLAWRAKLQHTGAREEYPLLEVFTTSTAQHRPNERDRAR